MLARCMSRYVTVKRINLGLTVCSR